MSVSQVRRPQNATLEKRQRLLDATERIMLRDGYAAVTSRRVESEAGVKPHYHFGTLDELFVAVVRRRAEENVARLSEALNSSDPLRAWWQVVSEPAGNRMVVEITAAANHRPALQAEVATFARTVRRMEIEALQTILGEYGIDPEQFPPALIAPAIEGLAFAMAYDLVSGFDTAHDEAEAAMERLLDRLSAERRPATGP